MSKRAFENIVGKGENADDKYLMFSYNVLHAPTNSKVKSMLVYWKFFSLGQLNNFVICYRIEI